VSPAAMPISVSIDFGMITPDELPSFRIATRIPPLRALS
jgi:hypothetical protein